MKIIRNKSGITLIALVITIIILLILAAVSINAVMDSGIFKRAKNATAKYKESENAEKIVKFLDRRKEVLWVRYPSARLSQYHELQEKYFPKGAGPVFTFGFLGDREQLDRFFRALKVFSYHVNIGDVRSIISNTSRTTHAELDSEELDAAGITQQTVRISAGIEDADDLIADLAQAFEAAFR